MVAKQRILVRYFTVAELENIAKAPEFCKGLSKKCSGHRINSGVQGISEMYGSVVFSYLF